MELRPEGERGEKAVFFLREAYRQGGRALKKKVTAPINGRVRQNVKAESRRRLAQALDGYDKVIAAWGPRDAAALAPVEEAYLRASYVYRADCLFDLGRYAQAVNAYREAAWRYEGLPAAVSASMQVVHALRQLGQLPEAAAALARVRWLLAKTPDSAFQNEPGSAGKLYWQAMVQRLETVGLY